MLFVEVSSYAGELPLQPNELLSEGCDVGFSRGGFVDSNCKQQGEIRV